MNLCMHTNWFITKSCISGDRDKSDAEYLQRKKYVWAPMQTKLHGLKIRAHSDPKLKKRRFFYPISVAAAASSPRCAALSEAPNDKGQQARSLSYFPVPVFAFRLNETIGFRTFPYFSVLSRTRPGPWFWAFGLGETTRINFGRKKQFHTLPY